MQCLQQELIVKCWLEHLLALLAMYMASSHKATMVHFIDMKARALALVETMSPPFH